jgi:hypothetical protein
MYTNSVMHRSFYTHNTITTINKLCYEQYMKFFLTMDSTPQGKYLCWTKIYDTAWSAVVYPT